METQGRGIGRDLLLLTILALPLAVGAFLRADWSWGFAHLRFAGPIWPVLFFGLFVGLWIPGAERRYGLVSERFGSLLARRSRMVPILLGLAGLALFAALPIATRMYGDSRYMTDDYSPAYLGANLRRMFTFGVNARGAPSFVLHDLVARATGLGFERSFQLVSVLCGAVFVYAHARLAAAIGRTRPRIGFAVLLLGLTDGANQLFFGHVENYTVVRLFECLFLIEFVRAFLTDRPRPPPPRAFLWLVLALLFHSQSVVLVPTALIWLGLTCTDRSSPVGRLFPGRAAAAALAMGIAVVAIAYLASGASCYDYIYSGGRPQLRQLFLPITTACTGLPFLRYTLFSGAHFLDLATSLYTITGPAALLAIAALLPGGVRTAGVVALLPAVLFATLHNFMLNFAIGFPFDWDLACVLSPPLLYAAVYLLARAPSPSPRLLAGLLPLAVGTCALFSLNADAGRVHRRVEEMGIWLHRTYYGGSHYRISSNLSTIADRQAQIRERERVLERLEAQTYPDDREVAFLWERLATMRIEDGSWTEALEAYRHALEIEPSRWDRKKPVGYLESEVGDVREGLRLLTEYVAAVPGDGEAFLLLGDAQAATGNLDGAKRSWRRFLDLSPDAPEADRVREDLQRSEEDVPPGGG